METHYYDAALDIDGTADELASMAERYTDDYSDEALKKIISILQEEKKNDKAQRITFELESRREVRNKQFDLGRIKLWALDGMYQLVDEDADGYHIDVVSEQGQVFIGVMMRDDRTNAVAFSLDQFLNLTSEEFENTVNETIFYAS